MMRKYRLLLPRNASSIVDPHAPSIPWMLFDALGICIRLVSGNVATLEKCYGSHSKDRKDKYIDKYTGKDKDKNVGE